MRKRNRSALPSDANCLEKADEGRKDIRSMSACHISEQDALTRLSPSRLPLLSPADDRRRLVRNPR